MYANTDKEVKVQLINFKGQTQDPVASQSFRVASNIEYTIFYPPSLSTNVNLLQLNDSLYLIESLHFSPFNRMPNFALRSNTLVIPICLINAKKNRKAIQMEMTL